MQISTVYNSVRYKALPARCEAQGVAEAGAQRHDEFARQLDVVLRSYYVAHTGDAHTGHTAGAGRGQRRRRATGRRARSSARAAVSLKLLNLSGRAHVHRGAEEELRGP